MNNHTSTHLLRLLLRLIKLRRELSHFCLTFFSFFCIIKPIKICVFIQDEFNVENHSPEAVQRNEHDLGSDVWYTAFAIWEVFSTSNFFFVSFWSRIIKVPFPKERHIHYLLNHTRELAFLLIDFIFVNPHYCCANVKNLTHVYENH